MRSFVTGLSRMSHLLTKHLMGGLPEGDSRRIVAFSDSREGAATLAVGVEAEQWQHLLRVFLLRLLTERARAGVLVLQKEVIAQLDGGDVPTAVSLLSKAKELLGNNYQALLHVFRTAKELKEMPAIASDSDRELVASVRAARAGFVRLDDLLGIPVPGAGNLLTPVWKEFAAIGVNPAGARLDERTLKEGVLDWTAVFERDGGHLKARLAPNLSDAERQHLQGPRGSPQEGHVARRVRAPYLRPRSAGHRTSRPGSDAGPFVRSGDQRGRTAGRLRKHIAHPDRGEAYDTTRPDAAVEGWKAEHPTGSKAEGIAKKRVHRY